MKFSLNCKVYSRKFCHESFYRFHCNIFSFYIPSISQETSAMDAPTTEGFMSHPPIPLSERNFRRRRPARRYGSIRVEECSFVEHDGASPSQPPVANYSLYEDVYPQKSLYVDKASMVPKHVKEQHSSPDRKSVV